MKQLLPLHRTPSHCPIDVLQEACLMALSAGSVKNSRRWACLEDVLSCALFQVTGTLEALSSAQCGIVSPVFFSPQPALIVTCVLSRAASVGHLLRTSVQFSSVQDGIYALGKAHMRSTPSETVPMFVRLTMALSRPFKEERLALPLSTPLSSRR